MITTRTPSSLRRKDRPSAGRHHSASEASGVGLGSNGAGTDGLYNHERRKSTYTVTHGMTLEMRRRQRADSVIQSRRQIAIPKGGDIQAELSPVQEVQSRKGSPPSRLGAPVKRTNILTPPTTPIRREEDDEEEDGEVTDISELADHTVMSYDFSRIDYELDRARAIGSGLWSDVYLAQPVIRSPKPSSSLPTSSSSILTPPSTPKKTASSTPPCSLYAVKLPTRKDSLEVFSHEARILTHLCRSPQFSTHIVPFHGLDPRNDSLIFSAVLGGSLENLLNRLQMMTEVSRHLELRALFPSISSDLVNGLTWLHTDQCVIHADIKPANVLLDIVSTADQPRPVLRARYIDFSASFLIPDPNSTDLASSKKLPAGGGTWAYMAPEQLRFQPGGGGFAPPSQRTDIWSLGVTLLSLIVGGSPYSAACGGGGGDSSTSTNVNVFMLREAVKTGDPLGFARMDPVVAKRMAACQDYVDFCRAALQKEPERRIGAIGWGRAVQWLA